jgi:4-amino-4-deoxy-L-arabinose transferase-like glycosyltransferase
VPINSSTEARELSVAWEIQQTGDWLTPSRNGLPVSKPPLYHWILASFGLDITPGLGRSINVLAALGILALLYLYSLYNHSTQHFALTALILFSTHGFLNSAMDARVDMTAAFFITASIIALSRSKLLIGGITIGLSILAKGPVGLILSLGGSYLLGAKRLILPCLVGLAIGGSWYCFLFFAGDQATLERQIIFENIQRFFGGANINSEPWYHYTKDLLRKAFPWSFVFLFALFRPLGVVTKERNIFIFGLIFFSLASGKRFSYLVPLFPWFAVFLSSYLAECWRRLSDLDKSRIIKASSVLFSYTSGLLTLSIPALELFSLPISLNSPSVHIALVWLESARFKIAGVLVVGLISTYLLRRDLVGRLVPLFLSFWILLGWSAEGIKGALKDFDRAANRINQIVGDQSLTVVKESQDELFDPIIFNLKRKISISDKLVSGFVLSRTPECEVIEVFEQVPDKEKGRTDRRIFLSRCP